VKGMASAAATAEAMSSLDVFTTGLLIKGCAGSFVHPPAAEPALVAAGASSLRHEPRRR
jgi:hypothetical protein